ncbi:hypothetical protein CLOBOL_05130 [Enterocloster bolteae ATCC BAA-613]|uniref:Uncharacterized protein n=1 Tax=Enterocloster bolteae (strain ATCC BAA-613 / DSM 15670 / CCUG 46953 / JCM 12243 / WAL 16351) TaxID=411902 RepID=A8RYH7_ENTBW|nr:hypothetical protein CLOBOL_05130 [Enterocloster bolteae ATCC BAA-613]
MYVCSLPSISLGHDFRLLMFSDCSNHSTKQKEGIICKFYGQL